MLSRKFRAARADIENAIKNGMAVSENYLHAKVSKKNANMPGFAIVVSKKIEKTSVGRHRIKRKISAAIEENLKKMNENFKKTIVFFPKKTEKPISYSEIKKDIDEILKKVGFYIKNKLAISSSKGNI